ncbi:elongation of very long chain fatty acids protein 1-like isoform X2 [Belonocnema kinseyi]|uniref:elongation of very long chain fatty acids protein 1-like isoform X2 n=1 Tax=Belonocnema kinseyi TaxID=2817044 RepID=UPI00143D1B96|nr:elongation of very long chain fatty acids protein 1-like isoform X2 [Belonocnema kinseyi]
MELVEMFNYYYHEMAASYVYFVFYYGPRFMMNRPAYALKTFVQLYNILQVIANAYLVYAVLTVYPDATALRCSTVDYSSNPNAIKIARTFYYFTLLKIVDLMETGVFVLRKKKNQISYLHLYHHLSTLFFALLYTRYMAGGVAAFFLALNSAVHTIMYSYYLFSSIEEIKGFIHPFKRYITIIQMVQLSFFMLKSFVGLSPSCSISKLPVILMLPNILLNFSLFFNFYKKTYLSPKKMK